MAHWMAHKWATHGSPDHSGWILESSCACHIRIVIMVVNGHTVKWYWYILTQKAGLLSNMIFSKLLTIIILETIAKIIQSKILIIGKLSTWGLIRDKSKGLFGSCSADIPRMWQRPVEIGDLSVNPMWFWGVQFWSGEMVSWCSIKECKVVRDGGLLRCDKVKGVRSTK